MCKEYKKEQKQRYELMKEIAFTSFYDKQLLGEMLYNTIALLEKYIEDSSFYQDWHFRKQIHGNKIKTNNKIFDSFSTNLLIFSINLKDFSFVSLNELWDGFYRWIDATEINAKNCSEHLKVILVRFYEVLEGKDGKIVEDYNHKKRKLDSKSIEYRKKLLEIVNTFEV